MKKQFKDSKGLPGFGTGGFTLVELMVALLVTGLVMAAVVGVYTTQLRSYTNQDEISDIQQRLRGIIAIIPPEIRLAGCDPNETGTAKILTATRTRFHFTMDITDNFNSHKSDGDVADTDENIDYQFAGDPDGDGIVGSGATSWTGTGVLGRQTGGTGGYQPIASNIDALEFNYILKDNTTSLTPSNPNSIRAVQISILARADSPDPQFLQTGSYTTASGATWTPPQDNFRRRFIVTTIQCRNRGY